MYLDENVEKASSIMDSPILTRLERARQRQEGKSVLCYQPNPPLGHVIQRGLLWQQRDKLFARWKERYFILTEDYLHCFRKATDNGFDRISYMGPFIFKIKLVDVERVTWINKKTYSAIALSFGRSDRILLRAQQGLEDWFDSLEECTIASKKRRHALKCQKEPYQGANEYSANSVNSNVEDWLTARRKIAQLHRNYISDSVPDISKLDCPGMKNLGNLHCEDGPFDNDVSKESCQRLSLLTDIDINALDTASSLIETKATPTPCRLNKDVFFLPGLFKARQRSSIAGPEILSDKIKHQNPARSQPETDSSELKSRNFLGSFRIPKRFQTTHGLANRYSLMDEPNALQFVYSTYENSPLSPSTFS